MFQTIITNNAGRPLGRPIWVTGSADEAKTHDFAWSEILQAWAKPADAPGGLGDWPELIDNGVYTLPVFAGPSGTHRFVVEALLDQRGFLLRSVPDYLDSVIGVECEDRPSWHVDVTGIVYDSDMQPVTTVTMLDFTGVVFYGVHSDAWTPERAAALGNIIGNAVRGFLEEDATQATHESALAAEADDWELSHER